MTEKLLIADQKGEASDILGELLISTANNFPEPQFRAKVVNGNSVINPYPYSITSNADGIGTKPEVIERIFTETDDPDEFESLAFDLIAMIDGDAARDGLFLVGVVEIVDTNTAYMPAVKALARGLYNVAKKGQFAVINGETAELGDRAGGYGRVHLNWNATGLVLDVPEKRITGENLRPGQPIVAFREESTRSNGYGKAYNILDSLAFCIDDQGFRNMSDLLWYFMKEGIEAGNGLTSTARFMKRTPLLYDILNASRPQWHKTFPEIARQLKIPSRLYGPIMYDAQGGVFGERKVDLVAAAHITGGGIPLKGIRMVKGKSLGIVVDQVFPDPEALISIYSLVKKANSQQSKFSLKPVSNYTIDDIEACETWNRGIGFMVVVENKEEARKLIDIAGDHNCEAAIAVEVIDEPAVNFRGHTWYYPKPA